MSSSEELSQYDNQESKTFKSVNSKTEDGTRPSIERDMFGLFGVHVSNLPSGITEASLEKTFSVVGRVQVCKLLAHNFQPYAFVKFSVLKEAQDALLQFDGYKLNGCVLNVRPAYSPSKMKRNPSSGGRSEHRGSFLEKGRGNSNKDRQETNHETSYAMGPSDCRVKDGRLSDGDVMMFNGVSGKVTPPRKVNGGRTLAPRFKKDSPPKSLTSNTSQESRRKSHEFLDGRPSDFSDSSSSAFRPYQGKLQDTNLEKTNPVKNGVVTLPSSLSNLRLSPPEHNHPSCFSHIQENGSSTWQQGGAQGVTSWSHTGSMGIMSLSNSNDQSMNNASRYQNVSMPGCSPQVRCGVSSWSTTDVVQYFLSSDCAEYAGFFQEQEIDGKALLLLNRDTLLHFLKVGPALKVLQIIDELKSYSPPSATGSNTW